MCVCVGAHENSASRGQKEAFVLLELQLQTIEDDLTYEQLQN